MHLALLSTPFPWSPKGRRPLLSTVIAPIVAATMLACSSDTVPGDPAPNDAGARDGAGQEDRSDDGAFDVTSEPLPDGAAPDQASSDVAIVDATRPDAFTDASDPSLDANGALDGTGDAPRHDTTAMPDGGVTDVPTDSPNPLDPPKLATRRLTTRGDVLIDELGRAVILRGVNVGGRSKMPPFLPFDFTDASEISAKADRLMSAVRALGGNAVRLTFSWEALESARGTFDAEYLRRYRLLLDAAHKADLHVIVDFHQDVFHAAFCGDGFPEWALGDIPHGPPHYDCAFPFWSLPYFDTASTVSQAFDRLWKNQDGLLDAFEAMWRHVAREVGKHPAVAAFEIINEPGAGSTPLATQGATVLPPLYDRIAAVIEAEAGAAAIVCDEPVSATADVQYLTRPAHPRFAYGPHYYDGATMLGIGPLDPARIRGAVSTVLARTAPWNAPVILGEFGAPNSVSFKPEYLVAIFDALDTGRASGLLWDVSFSAQKWNNEDFGPLSPDGVESAWAPLLDRPFPRAIDGTVTSFKWDAVAKQFDLYVSAAGDHVSEIYVPVRHLGMAPDITVSGARSRFVPTTGQILVAAPRGAAWSLSVKGR
jgi:endoglycosylceramidase